MEIFINFEYKFKKDKMKNQQFLKGLLMTLAGVFVVAFDTTPIVWTVLAITLIGTALVYTGKNAILFLKSTGPAGTLNWINILSALLIAIGSALVQAVATIVTNGVISWTELGKVVLAVTFTYLSTTLFAGKNTDIVPVKK